MRPIAIVIAVLFAIATIGALADGAIGPAIIGACIVGACWLFIRRPAQTS